MTPLSDRISAALKAGTSAGVAELIDEVTAAAEAAVRRNSAAKERALDPLLSSDDVAEARKASEDAAFEAQRMTRATEKLREALTAFKAAEQQVERRAAYDDAIAKRDAAVEALRRYPALANQIGSILAEAAAADRAVEAANAKLPDGFSKIPSAERIARGELPVGTLTPPSPIGRLVLPALQHGKPKIWGPGNTMSSTSSFIPEITDADKAGHYAGSDRTDGASASGSPSPSVRLVPRMEGNAA